MSPESAFILSVVALSLAFQVAATYMAFMLVRETGRAIGWILIAAAIPFAALRRVLVLSDMLFRGISPDPLAEVVALGFSALLFLGLLKIEPFFLSVKTSEEKFKSLSEKSLVGVYLIQDNVFNYANPLMSEIFGYSVEDLTGGMGPKDVVHPDDWPIVEDNIRRRIRGEMEAVHYEFRCIRKDRRVINVEVFGSRTTHQGRPAVVGTLLDITARKKTEDALKLFQTLIDHSNDSIEVRDPKTGGLLSVNKKTSTDLGYSREELLSMKVFDIDPLVRPEDFPKIVEEIRKTGTALWEGVRRRKDGSTFPVEVSLKYVQLDRDYMVAVARDITKRKQMEDELTEKKRRLSTLLDNLHGMVYRCRNDRDWTTEFVSSGSEALTGYRPDELFGNRVVSYGQLIHPEDSERVWNEVQSALKDRKPFKLAYRIFSKDGLTKWVWEQGVGVFSKEGELQTLEGFITDITERKLMEEKIIRAKEEWERTFDAVIDPIMILDTEYRIVRANKAMASALGVAPAGAVGMTCYEHVHGTNEPIPDCPHQKLLKDGKPHTAEIFEDRLGDTFLVNVSPLYDETGKLIGSVHSARDITEIKQAAADLMRMNRALETIRLCDQALVREKEEEPLLREICRVLVERGGYRMAWVGYAMDDEKKTVRPVACAGVVEGYLDRARITYADTERGRGPTGTAIRTGTPVLVKDMATDPMMAPWREEALWRGYASSIALPLMDGPKGFGAFNIYASVPDAFDKEEITLLTELSNDLANGIIAIRAHEGKLAAEERVRRSFERISALRDIDMAISSSFDLTVTLNILLDQVVAKLGVDAADVLLLNPYSQMLEHVADRGFATLAASMVSQHLGEGYAGRVALERRQIILPGLTGVEDERLHAFKNVEGFDFYIGLPLVAKGAVKGVLEIYHKAQLRPDPEWLEFLASLAGQAAIAAENSLMLTALQRSHDELVIAYDATIEGWARALDYRDKETEGHSRRVTEMAASIAVAMGISDEELVQVRRGALLHDIGKLGIPDSILLKPGKLTDEEWRIMKAHPVIAHKILSPIAFLRPAIDIPYSHHEKWDGTGYPHGFKGDEIPLSARIFAVVDVWDALRSDRPYRPAWPEEKALEYIKSLSGKEFDPKVVEVFLKSI